MVLSVLTCEMMKSISLTLWTIMCVKCREKFAAYVASGGSVINLLLVLKFIPKHTKKHNTKKNNDSKIEFI